MSRPFTIEDLKKSPCWHLNEKRLSVPVKNKQKALPKISVEKRTMQIELEKFCSEHGFELKTEYRFNPERKWRADWAIEELKCLIEFEGIMSAKSRHTSILGYSGDADKYSSASILGFTILRYTVINYLNITTDLTKIIWQQ